MHELRKNKHPNSRLQNSFNKHGEKIFSFKIVELCKEKDVTNREQFYLDFHKPYLHGYNLALSAYHVMLGRKHSDESKIKMSQSQKGKKLGIKRGPMSLDQKIKLSVAVTGFRHTEEAKIKISESSLARGVFSAAHLANMSAAQKGHAVSEKQRQDIRKALTGRKASPEAIAKRSASMKRIIQAAKDKNGGIVPWLVKSHESKKRNRELKNVLTE